MILLELIGKDLLFRATLGAGAYKGFQMLMGLKSRAVLRCRHGILLFRGTSRFGSRPVPYYVYSNGQPIEVN